MNQKSFATLFYNKKREKMTRIIIADGVLHEVPEDMKKSLKSDANVIAHWNNLTLKNGLKKR